MTEDEAPNTQISSHMSVVLKALTAVLDTNIKEEKTEALEKLMRVSLENHMYEFNALGDARCPNDNPRFRR